MAKSITVMDPITFETVSFKTQKEAQEYLIARMEEAKKKAAEKPLEEYPKMAIKQLTTHANYGDKNAKFDVIGAFMREGSNAAIVVLKKTAGQIAGERAFIVCSQSSNGNYPKGVKNWTVEELFALGEVINSYKAKVEK